MLEKLNGVYVEIGGYVLSVSIKDIHTINRRKKLVYYHHIKTKRQEYFRETVDFYNEFYNIKIKKNMYDQWSGILSSSDKPSENAEHNKQMVLEILGVEESTLLEHTKKAIKEYVVAQANRELDELDG